MCTIYIVVIPHLALRNYIALLDLTNRCEFCEIHPRGEGRYGLIYCLEEIRQFEIPQHPLHFLFFFYDARYRRITPPTDSARRNIGSPYYISRILYLSVCLSVCLRFFLSYFRARTPACVNTHTETYVGDTWIFISVSPCPLRGNTFLDHH